MKEIKNIENGIDAYINHHTTFERKQEKEWYEPVIDYYIELAKSLNDKVITQDNINAAKGMIDEATYKEVLAQLNDKNMTIKIEELNLLDNVDIITPIKERYMGEYVKSPNFYTCTVESPDITLALNEKVQKKVYAIFMAKLQTNLQEMKDELVESGMEDDAIQKELSKINIKDEIEKIKDEFFMQEASKAKQIVQFFVKQSRFEETLYQLFYYFLATEEVYIEIEPFENKIDINVIVPTEYYRICDDRSNFVEDDEAGVIITKTSIRKILDDYRDQISENDITYLKTLLSNTSPKGIVRVDSNMLDSRRINMNTLGTSGKVGGIREEVSFSSNVDSVLSHKVYMRTKRNVGYLKYQLQTGEIKERIVGESYKLDIENGDVSIDWDWKDEVYVGYRFGTGDGVGVYIPPKPVIVQRNEIETSNSPKIPIIGASGILSNYGVKPICSRMLSHQAMYIILTNKLYKEIAKFHGYITLIAESILSDSNEFEQAARLEYMYKDSLLIFNDSEVDVNILQALRTVGNSGQADYIRIIKEIREGIKQEAWDLSNMNPERFGAIDTKGGMSNTQEAIRRISTGSVMFFTTFDMFKERAYQAISDYGRIVYTNGINTNYFENGTSRIELDISHEELISSVIGVFFTNNIIEKEKVESMRQAIVSSNIQSNDIVAAIDSIQENDLYSLKQLAIKMKEATLKREEQMAANQQEVAKYIEDKKAEVAANELQNKLDVVEMTGSYDLLKEDKRILAKILEIQSEKEMVALGADSNANGVNDSLNDSLSETRARLEISIKEQQLLLAKEKTKQAKVKPPVKKSK